MRKRITLLVVTLSALWCSVRSVPHAGMTGSRSQSNSVRLLKLASTPGPTATLTSAVQVYYFGTITVNSQSFSVIYDTGSSLTWVPSPTCGATCNGLTRYVGSYQSLQNMSMTYGSGTVSGHIFSGALGIAGLTINNQRMGLVDTVGFPGFAYGNYEGIMGLAWKTLADPYNVPTITETLYSQGLIAAPMFAIYLAPDGSNGELMLGQIDTTKCIGSASYVPLTQASWWTVNMDSAAVGSTNVMGAGANMVSVASIVNQPAIVDSGTSLITIPHTYLVAIINQIDATVTSYGGTGVTYDSANQIYTVPCSSVGFLPPVSFSISGGAGATTTITIPGASYVIRSLSSNSNVCPLAFADGGSGVNAMWIIADPVLRQFCTVYDYGGVQIGFTQAANSPATVSTTRTFGDALNWLATTINDGLLKAIATSAIYAQVVIAVKKG